MLFKFLLILFLGSGICPPIMPQTPIIGIIGGADGPTAIYISVKPSPFQCLKKAFSTVSEDECGMLPGQMRPSHTAEEIR